MASEGEMDAADPVTHIPPRERIEADPTPGMVREQAIAVEGLWVGVARTEAGMTSAWHHHGDHETSIYILSGALRMQSGPGGAEVIDARPGDFLYVPKRAVHREGNPTDRESEIVVVRAGHGPTTVNVDGPAD